jgi:2-keto-4-pentenoate hydratase/2-oxohepta-3-ene-1,7-dioic acid hydratase in catechol pathway
MKLLSYGPPGKEKAGILVKEKIIDLEQVSQKLFLRPLPGNLKEFLELPDWTEKLQNISSAINSLSPDNFIDMAQVRIGPPINQPSKIIALGANYKEHLEETKMDLELPKTPILFSKTSNSVNGPYDHIIYPPETQALDYEVELAIVIGQPGKRIQPEVAYDYIAGYIVFNDISARDLQLGGPKGLGSQWFRGKSLDSFAPMGPWVVTRDELPDPHNLRISLRLNGEIRQDSNTSFLIFKIPEIIAFVSSGITLLPGDIISTGTPSGVGMFSNPPRLLQPGDVVRAEIEGIGFLENKVVLEEEEQNHG